MTKMLLCQGTNPPHEFENPNAGKRGRPPKFCPEHHPKNQEQHSGGTFPISDSPEGATVLENPFIKKAKAQEAAKKMERVREGKPEKAERLAKDALRAMEVEYTFIGANIRRAEEAYQLEFDKANAVRDINDIDRAWNKADKRQSALLGLLARRRVLVEVLHKDDPLSSALHHLLDADDSDTTAAS